MKYTNMILPILIIILSIIVIPQCLSEIIKGKNVHINLIIIIGQIPAYIQMIQYFLKS
jgi:hypothetical protein